MLENINSVGKYEERDEIRSFESSNVPLIGILHPIVMNDSLVSR